MIVIHINWLAFVVAGLAALVYGFIAIGPLTMRIWMPLLAKAKIKPFNFKDRPDVIVVEVVGAFASTFVLDLVIQYGAISTWWLGIVAGAIVWVGFGGVTGLLATSRASWPFGLWVYGFFAQLILYAGQGLLFSLWK